MKMSYYGASGSSTLNRPSKSQSKNNNSFPQQMTLPFATSIMNNLKVSKECSIVKHNKQQHFPTNNIASSSDIDLENFGEESCEADVSKVKQKNSSKNNKKLIGFSWSAITNNQKDKPTSHMKVNDETLFIWNISILFVNTNMHSKQVVLRY